MTAPVIRVRDLQKRFGHHEALCGLDFTVPAGVGDVWFFVGRIEAQEVSYRWGRK